MNKVFYFHVPKTAGSTLSNLLDVNFNKTIHHIEGLEPIKESYLKSFDAVSGHVTYTNMDKILNLEEWTTIATFREPYSHVVSHISWIRKLADKGEEERFQEHPKVFQEMALFMKTLDFSNPNDIRKLITYFDDNKLLYMNNTQTLYMDNNKRLDYAIRNISKIDILGITEEINDFFTRIFSFFNWGMYENNAKRLNGNRNKYKFDISNEDTRNALYPLISKDLILYKAVVDQLQYKINI